MKKYTVFIGTYSKGGGKGLFRCEFDETTGELRVTDSLDIENPSYLCIDRDILYGVSETDSFQGENGGGLFAVSIMDGTNGTDSQKMKLLSMCGTHGKSPCHLCVQDNFIFAANYSDGSLSIFETDTSGNIKFCRQSICHFGKSVNPVRQETPHIHFAAVTPDNKYLAVCDLGVDKVFLYPYSAENAVSTNAKNINCPPGAGPRHLTFSNFSKDGKYLYILTELHNTVLVYKYNGGNAGLLQVCSTIPAEFSGESTAAAIHVSPGGALLAASNRGHDSIAVFNIQENGELAFLDHIPTGREPRDFRFSPGGKWILSANQNDDSVTIYQNKKNKFTQTGSISLPKPACILFGGENVK